MGSRTSRLLAGLGRALITLGVLVILFAAFQLWGTSLAEEQAQDSLQESFRRQQQALVAAAGSATSTTTPAQAPAPAPEEALEEDGADDGAGDPPPAAQPVVAAPPLPPELMPRPGETMGRIVIPSIGVDKFVIEGVRRADLRQGPGHYPTTPLPGQAGNAAIAGHRTTYGAPFGDLDRLVPGDEIIVETLQGRFHYRVMGHPGPEGAEVGHLIVDPVEGVSVLDDKGDDRLTLTACHPRYSAAQRIVVTAELTGPPAPSAAPVEVAAAPPGGGDTPAAPSPEQAEDEAERPATDPTTTAAAEAEADDVAFGESLGWNWSLLPVAATWAAATAAVALAVWLLARRWRRRVAWVLGSPVILAALFVTFGHVDRLLPAL